MERWLIRIPSLLVLDLGRFWWPVQEAVIDAEWLSVEGDERALILIEHGNSEILTLFGSDAGCPTHFHDDSCVPNGVTLVDTAGVRQNAAFCAAVLRVAIRAGIMEAPMRYESSVIGDAADGGQRGALRTLYRLERPRRM